MPKGIGIIRWNNQLGPYLETSYPDEIKLNPQLVVHLYTSQTMGDIATPRLTSLSTDELKIISYFGGHQDPSLLVLFLEKYEAPEAYESVLIDAFMSMPKDVSTIKPWLTSTLQQFKNIQPLHHQKLEFKNKLLNILNTISLQQITQITPKFDYETGIKYPQLDSSLKIPSIELGRLLEHLANMDYLIREIHDSLLACPDCNSPKLQIKWACPICNSRALEKSIIIEHYLCGVKTLGAKFITSKGMKCPKCATPLKTEGIDYTTLGLYYYCHKCKNYFSNPLKQLLCHNCGLLFSEDNANLILVIGYKTNQQLIHKCVEHPDTFLIEEVNL
ncbi:MAG: hypothetical protein ACTSRS_14755 [Candidatus Helarchaeota archaeon]